ncbi:MAG: DegT/DnrJ/EryC1/StrS family aminotransferase [Nanoarchaeota archaeon]|nr:DegT/DnrJ/EryC1/StrS family aminotransferase [Nanoarchaeota archaeon]
MPEEEFESEERKERKDDENQKEEIVSLLKQYTRHDNVRLVARGNAAILEALYIVKKVNPKPFVLIPDQGGWISFQTYPQIFGFEVKAVKTNRGVIDLVDLEKKANGGAALLITSFAGYFAEQPLKYIANICHEHNCLLIEDASGAVGDKTLCNGEFSDMILGSFGRWKPINNEYGGFISAKEERYFTQGKEVLTATNFYPRYDVLLKKLKDAKRRLEQMYKLQEKVKEEIEALGVKVLHRNLRGLNVVAKPMKQEETEDVIKYCEEHNYEYVECPKYIRLDEEAISIELKRIDPDNIKLL